MVNFQVPSAPALTAGASEGKGSGRHKIRVAVDVVGRFAYGTLDHDGTSGSLAIVDLGG